ncbi:ABC transporter ATP-binding protein [Vibrio diazotrophicus]|uniref:ABC transporter ATP-binding protein n=1 Tax=Vibrio diazotrophicus TaxID=685 RepID=UPI00142D7008|nr:sn-glycerol-3-phosphate ABC transporter ATP-binding protein UgpC [Vibrio diazotrophicus]NIY92528.1 sn-glycerol-3-phosphate ABC transporter ATP-binding protein UgpC [Vibrio diazotrophicus]
MAAISLHKINKTYDDKNVVVPSIDLEIKDKEFIILVGPSGCGKSTTLRMIAGLEDISSGELFIGGKLVNDVPSKDRDIAMVFQNYALYPHMTVYQNMAFGLELRKVDRDIIEQKVQEAAEILDISHLLNRKPKALSGGQRQRVALGRAMVRDPEVFLLDEPLSNLDAKLRGTMRAEISKLHKRLNSTFIYVTHDQVEAMTMADRIVVMKDGIIQQVDTPQELYDNPANIFVAGFIGAPQMNFISAKLTLDGSDFQLSALGKTLTLPSRFSSQILDAQLNEELVLGIRPEDIYVKAPKDVDENLITPMEFEVDLAEPMGSEVHLSLTCKGHKMVAKITSRLDAKVGDKLTLYIDMTHAHLFNEKTTQSLMHL